MYSIGLASIFAVIVLVLSRTVLDPVWIIVLLHHQATWSVSLRQVLDIVQGLYHLAPEVVTSRNSRDGSQGVTPTLYKDPITFRK
jgi:hypothetical protein